MLSGYYEADHSPVNVSQLLVNSNKLFLFGLQRKSFMSIFLFCATFSTTENNDIVFTFSLFRIPQTPLLNGKLIAIAKSTTFSFKYCIFSSSHLIKSSVKRRFEVVALSFVIICICTFYKMDKIH